MPGIQSKQILHTLEAVMIQSLLSAKVSFVAMKLKLEWKCFKTELFFVTHIILTTQTNLTLSRYWNVNQI